MYYKIVLTDKFEKRQTAQDIINMLVDDGWAPEWFEIVEVGLNELPPKLI